MQSHCWLVLPQVRKGKGGCPYLAGAKSEVAQLADAVLAAPLDVEELAAAGRRSGACPYYAARRAVPQADLLLLPYPSLLLKARRTPRPITRRIARPWGPSSLRALPRLSAGLAHLRWHDIPASNVRLETEGAQKGCRYATLRSRQIRVAE